MRTRERGALTSEDAFDLLRNPYRRRLVMTLLDHNPEDEAAIPDDLTTDDEELEEMLIAIDPFSAASSLYRYRQRGGHSGRTGGSPRHDVHEVRK